MRKTLCLPICLAIAYGCALAGHRFRDVTDDELNEIAVLHETTPEELLDTHKQILIDELQRDWGVAITNVHRLEDGNVVATIAPAMDEVIAVAKTLPKDLTLDNIVVRAAAIFSIIGGALLGLRGRATALRA
jgi:hypothetical protein